MRHADYWQRLIQPFVQLCWLAELDDLSCWLRQQSLIMSESLCFGLYLCKWKTLVALSNEYVDRQARLSMRQ